VSTLQTADQNESPKLVSGAAQLTKHHPVIDLALLAVRPSLISSDSTTIAWIRRHPVMALVGLAYGLSWIGIVPMILYPNLPLDPGHISLLAVIVAFLGVLGCLWAAVMVATATGGLASRRTLLLGYLQWRVGLPWYLVVLLTPAAVWLVGMGIALALMGKIPAAPAFTYPPLTLLTLYGSFLVRYLVGNYEEICWRASLLPRLQTKYTALVASLMVGVIQGVWHLPYAFVTGHFVQVIGLPAMVLMSMAMSIVFAWVYIGTRGSLLLVALFHAAYDALSPFQGSDITQAYLTIGVWWAVALLVVAIFGAQRLSRKPAADLANTIQSEPAKLST
jgi:uncharacterized protein